MVFGRPKSDEVADDESSQVFLDHTDAKALIMERNREAAVRKMHRFRGHEIFNGVELEVTWAPPKPDREAGHEIYFRGSSLDAVYVGTDNDRTEFVFAYACKMARFLKDVKQVHKKVGEFVAANHPGRQKVKVAGKKIILKSNVFGEYTLIIPGADKKREACAFMIHPVLDPQGFLDLAKFLAERGKGRRRILEIINDIHDTKSRSVIIDQ